MASITKVSSTTSSISLKVTGMSSTYASGRTFHWYCTNGTEKWGNPVDAYATTGGNVTFSGLSSGTSYGFRVFIYSATSGSNISTLPSATTFDYFSTDTPAVTYDITLNRGSGIAGIYGTYYLTSSSSGVSFSITNQSYHTFTGFSSSGYIYVSSVSYSNNYSYPVTGYPALQGGSWTLINSSGTWSDHNIKIKSGSYGPDDRDVTISATYVPPTYSVSLGYVTGSANHVTLTGAGWYEEGDYVSINATPASGYTWNGWYNNTSGDTQVYAARSVGFYIYNNVTLCAKVTANPTYSLTLNFCTGSSGKGTLTKSPNKSAYDSGDYISAIASAGSNYDFAAWYYDAAATDLCSYSSTFNFYIYSNITLYAKFVNKAVTYTLSYSANGGSGAPSSQSSTTRTGSATFTVSSTVPTRTNYNFLGWAWSSTATTATVTPGQQVTISENKTLYAVWQKIYTPITYFNWTSDDATYIANGKSVSNITAAKWNSAYAKINEIQRALGQTVVDYSSYYVSQYARMYATNFNYLRNTINGLSGTGTMVNTQSSGNVIYSYLFVGNSNNNSIKKALNLAVDYANDNHV